MWCAPRSWLLAALLPAAALGSSACLGGPQPEPPTWNPSDASPGAQDGGAPPWSDAGAALDGGADAGAAVDAGPKPGPTVELPARLPPHLEPPRAEPPPLPALDGGAG